MPPIIDDFDKIFIKLWHQPLKIMCGISGRDNFFFAKVFGMLGIVFTVSNFVDSPLLITMVTILWLAILSSLYKLIKNVKASLHSTSLDTSIPLPEYDRELRVCFAGLSFCMLPVTFIQFFIFHNTLMHSGILIAIGTFLMGAAWYFATDIHPRKKSWITVGIKKLWHAARKIHIPNPFPQPRPIPLPVRS